MTKLLIRQLFIHPVKACRGIDVEETILLDDGTFNLDRKWCIVDLRGDRYPALQSLSQRLCPVLASIDVSVETKPKERLLGLHAPGMPTLWVSFSGSEDKSSALTKDEKVQVECGGASTTSAGSWHLGLLAGSDEGDAAAEWLSTYLNAADKSKASKPRAMYRLIRSTAIRSLATYAGPNQAPFDVDVSKQRIGLGSPFRMQNVPVKSNDGFRFHDVAPLHVVTVPSFQDLALKIGTGLQSPAPQQRELDQFQIRCFRPNVVVGPSSAGTADFRSRESLVVGNLAWLWKWWRGCLPSLLPWEEETWEAFCMGDHQFRVLKGCPRCTVPARDPFSGDFLFKSKPLLAPQMALRKFWPEKCVDKEWEEEWQGPMFGVHVGFDLPAPPPSSSLDPSGTGTATRVLRVGDPVVVLSKRTRPWGRGNGGGATSTTVLFAFFFLAVLSFVALNVW